MTNNEIRPSAENTEAEETLGGVAFDSIDDQAQTISASMGQSQPGPRASVETLLQRVVAAYLDSIRSRVDVSLQEVRDSVLSRANAEIGLENMARKGTAGPRPFEWWSFASLR
ncbi:hypothetical protein [Microbacterium sp. UMB0228]|uniref:hypothetical protein n=1 Tax=Microbacterium sp. UMB0228 TaxID=2029109 RepID=UPI0011AF4E6E|nr:hypothetical protein [Microbacterium sp. UMB0228]